MTFGLNLLSNLMSSQSNTIYDYVLLNPSMGFNLSKLWLTTVYFTFLLLIILVAKQMSYSKIYGFFIFIIIMFSMFSIYSLFLHAGAKMALDGALETGTGGLITPFLGML